ncbi:MAG: tetratricopeptide repeat protein [Pseudomonadota bacterium]
MGLAVGIIAVAGSLSACSQTGLQALERPGPATAQQAQRPSSAAWRARAQPAAKRTRPKAQTATVAPAVIAPAQRPAGQRQPFAQRQAPAPRDTSRRPTHPAVPANPAVLARLKARHADRPDNVVAAIRYARALRARDRKPAAWAVLQASAKRQPNAPRLMLERGLMAVEIGRFDEAERLLSKVARTNRQDWRVWSALGVARANRGQPKRARAALERALQLSPRHPTVLNNLAMAHALEGNAVEATKLLKQAVARGAPAAQVQRNLALLDAIRTRTGAAKRSVRRVTRVAPAAPPASKRTAGTRSGWFDQQADP